MKQLFRFVAVKLVSSGAWCNFIGGYLTLSENYRNPISRDRNQSLPSISLRLGQLCCGVISVRQMIANVSLGELKRGNCVGESGRAVRAQQAQHSQLLNGYQKFLDAKQFLSLSACYRLMGRAWSCKGQMGDAHVEALRERFKAWGKACCDDVRAKHLCLSACLPVSRGEPQCRPSCGNCGQCGKRAPGNGPVDIHFILFFARILT
jgi:hypothetical protein